MQIQNTILLVGNTEKSRTELRDIFTQDYTLLEAQNGDQEKLLLAENPGLISVIVADSSSSEGMSDSVMSQVIRLGVTHDIPVLSIIDENDTKREVLAYQCGANDVIRKPYLPLAMFQRTRTLIELSVCKKSLKSMEGLQEKAEKDALTGLFNRGASRQKINQLLTARSVTETEGISALLMIDLDNFKALNDTYGHLFGDEVLTRAAGKIRRLFRSNDIIGRIGGDEFIVFIDTIPDVSLIETRCQQLVDALPATFAEDRTDICISCSVGVALVPEHGNTLNELYHKADLALYKAKSLGKNRYVIYDEKDDHTMRNLVSAINTRIDSDEQPGMADNSLIHFVFQRLYETGFVYETIDEILGEVGRQMNVSRVYIFENNADNTGCSNTFEWCNKDIPPEIHNLQNISYTSGPYENWPEKYDENGVFYCADVSQMDAQHRNHLQSQGIKSMLHSAILDNGIFRGFIGFDECVTNRLWTTEQINTLVFLSQMLSLFLLKKRSQDESMKLAENLQSILDNQNAWIYVIDPETFRLRYVNRRTRNMSPVIREGALCYEVLLNRTSHCENCPAKDIMKEMNREAHINNSHFGLYVHTAATKIMWDGQQACLITCHEE